MTMSSRALSTACLALGLMLPLSGAMAHDHKSGHHHHHDHHAHDAKAEETRRQSKGFFYNAEVAPRALTDWAGDWQSVYPYLQDGTLDAVWEHKAASGKKTAAEHRASYETGYKTDVQRIEIGTEEVSFHRGDVKLTGRYVSDGEEILTYKAGNRGVRFVFKKIDGDADAPDYIQFSDHIIAPQKADHYHLYWGDDRAALLEEVTHWPTYYPAGLSGAEVAAEMTAH